MRPSVARMMAIPLPPRKVKGPMTPPLPRPMVSRSQMRAALYRAKVCLEQQIVALEDSRIRGTNDWYASVEGICEVIDVVTKAIGER